MTGEEFHAALAAIGARLVVKAKLPPGPGIFDDEIGGDGPWYGILFENDYTYGWTGTPDALMDAQVLLDYGGQGARIVDLLAGAIVQQRQAGRADGICQAANLVRYLRPDTACTCGSYLSFHNGVPVHQPGCLVGECMEAADEIEGLLEPPPHATDEAERAANGGDEDNDERDHD